MKKLALLIGLGVLLGGCNQTYNGYTNEQLWELYQRYKTQNTNLTQCIKKGDLGIDKCVWEYGSN